MPGMLSTFVSAGLLLAAANLANPNPAWADDDPWPDLQEALFPGKTIASGADFIRIDAPDRAFDAAVVPISIDFDLAKMQGRRGQDHDLGDRQESGAGRRRVPLSRRHRKSLDRHAGSGQRIHQHPRGGGSGGRAVVPRQRLRQGGGGLLGAGQQEHRRCQGAYRRSEAQTAEGDRGECTFEARAPDPAPELHRHADGSGDALLHPRRFRAERHHHP